MEMDGNNREDQHLAAPTISNLTSPVQESPHHVVHTQQTSPQHHIPSTPKTPKRQYGERWKWTNTEVIWLISARKAVTSDQQSSEEEALSAKLWKVVAYMFVDTFVKEDEIPDDEEKRRLLFKKFRGVCKNKHASMRSEYNLIRHLWEEDGSEIQGQPYNDDGWPALDRWDMNVLKQLDMKYPGLVLYIPASSDLRKQMQENYDAEDIPREWKKFRRPFRYFHYLRDNVDEKIFAEKQVPTPTELKVKMKEKLPEVDREFYKIRSPKKEKELTKKRDRDIDRSEADEPIVVGAVDHHDHLDGPEMKRRRIQEHDDQQDDPQHHQLQQHAQRALLDGPYSHLYNTTGQPLPAHHHLPMHSLMHQQGSPRPTLPEKLSGFLDDEKITSTQYVKIITHLTQSPDMIPFIEALSAENLFPVLVELAEMDHAIQ